MFKCRLTKIDKGIVFIIMEQNLSMVKQEDDTLEYYDNDSELTISSCDATELYLADSEIFLRGADDKDFSSTSSVELFDSNEERDRQFDRAKVALNNFVSRGGFYKTNPDKVDDKSSDLFFSIE